MKNKPHKLPAHEVSYSTLWPGWAVAPMIILALMLVEAATRAVTTNFTTAGTFSWTVPAGVTTVTVECWGGGGAGGSARRASGTPTTTVDGGGGAGGAYVKKSNITVVSENAYTVVIGSGGVAPNTTNFIDGDRFNGGDSYFDNSTVVLAKGGGGGECKNTAGSAAGTGGACPAGSVGDVIHSGGNGADGTTSPSSGGGGGSGGSLLPGKNASGTTGGVAVTGGGAGANGRTSIGTGSSPSGFGGGGSGAQSGSTTQQQGGSGANGKVAITYTLPAPTYTWVATTGSNDWTLPGSWSPSRTTPAGTDVLVFTNGGSSFATNVPTQTIGKLLVASNTAITLQPANGVNTLTISESAADALTVSADSQLNIFGAADATNLTINVATGAKASISGTMTFDNNFVSGTAFTLTASDTGGITFSSGAVFTQNCPGNIFGSGTANSVVFASGSTFVEIFGNNPFQKTQPASVVIFQSGSLFRVQGSTVNMSFSGRTYADLEINRTNFSDTATGSSPLTISNLSVLQGALSVSMGGGFNLLGNATVAAGASLTLNNNVTNASGKTIIVNGRLAGTATNYGNAAITISSTGTLAPGASGSSIGSLTFAAPPALNGTNYAKIDRNAGSPLADKVIVTSGSLSYGGTLVVTNIGASLQVNDTFTLFSAPGYAASGFNYLQLPDACTWDTSELTNNGTIRVSAIGGAPAPEPIVVQPQPGQLVMSWTQAAFALASSTNVAGPYEKIPGATSPYTNSTTNATLFFKLVYP